MRQTMNVQVAVGAAFVVTNLLADALGEDLRPAAWQRVQPCRHQLAQHLLVRLTVEIGEERNLDSGETLQMDCRTNPFEPAQQLRVIAERQVGVQAIDDVNFGERLIGALSKLAPGLVERHGVRVWIARLQAGERAEQAAGDADVGGFDADVEIVVGASGVPPLALPIREPADREKIGTLEQPPPVAERQALARIELVGDIEEAGVGDTAEPLIIWSSGHLVISSSRHPSSI